MATDPDYALMAANVYGNSIVVRDGQNTLPVPNGWTRLPIEPLSATPTGFMASAFRHDTTGEIVIAYAGTTPENGLDWLTGNVPAATAATLAPQVLEAAQFYQRVVAAHPAAANAISFTGHSLGGGLASLMAVYFDKPALTFDMAPFSKSADSTLVVNQLRSALFASPEGLPPELAAYETRLDPTGIFLSSPTRLSRQLNVRHIFVKGEALSLGGQQVTDGLSALLGAVFQVPTLWGFGITKIVNPDRQTEIDLNARTMLGWGWPGPVAGDPVSLHSMTLLAGVMVSSAFRTLVSQHPEVMPRLFAVGS